MVKGVKSGRWTDKEHLVYNEACNEGLSWKQISARVGTRNPEQCLSHHQKMKLKGCKGMMKM